MTTFSEAIRLEQGRLHNLAYHQARVDRTAGHFSGRVRASPVCRIQSPKRYGRGCSSAGSYMAATSGRSSTFLMYGDGSKSRSNPGRCHRLLLQIYGSEPIEYTAARFGVRRDRHCPPRSGDGCLGFQSRVRVCRRTFYAGRSAAGRDETAGTAGAGPDRRPANRGARARGLSECTVHQCHDRSEGGPEGRYGSIGSSVRDAICEALRRVRMICPERGALCRAEAVRRLTNAGWS